MCRVTIDANEFGDTVIHIGNLREASAKVKMELDDQGEAKQPDPVVMYLGLHHIDISNLMHCQRTINAKMEFKDGRRLETLVADLLSGKLNRVTWVP